LRHLESLKNKTREPPFLVSRVSKPRSLALPSLSHQLKKDRTAIQEVNIFLNGFLSYRSRETLSLTFLISQDEEGSVPNKQATLDRAGLTGNLVDLDPDDPDSIVPVDPDLDLRKPKRP
jgi:hypothetical protein